MLASVDAPTFGYIARSLEAGLRSLDVSISSQAAAAIDNLAGFSFRTLNPG